jgi:glycerol-3-phosphate dehydrogenase (NAD(P)+)
MNSAPGIDKVAVIGTTGWGTTLSVLLARRGTATCLWSWLEEEAAQLRREGENRLRQPGLAFPPALTVTHDLGEALAGAGLVVLAVPSSSLRENLRRLRPHLDGDAIVLSAVKGLESETGKRMSEVIGEELGAALTTPICVLSGPNLSREIARGLPAAAIVASDDLPTAETVRGLVMGPSFRVYTGDDVVGVELAGALKNIIAIGAGMGDGFGYGDNAKAAFLTRGLAEITRLGLAAGAQALTFSGLAGVGDLIATCSSPLSRNHTVGRELAKGRPLDEILSSLEQVAEGVTTAVAARRLARRLGVEMPITEKTCQVLFEGLDPHQGVAELMMREPRRELHGVQ